MARTIWLQGCRMEGFEGALGCLEGKRSSAMDAAQATVEDVGARLHQGQGPDPQALGRRTRCLSADQTLRT